MKKLKLLIPIFIIFFICLFYSFNTTYENDNNISNTKNEVIKKSRSLSMMLETGAGTGEYEATTRSTWPTDGYVFNSELSKCENGGKLSWDDTNNTVVMTGSTSDKCYVFFDVYIPTLTEYVVSQFTGEQGANGVYYHNGTIKSGETVIDANDGSYRYAGSNPNNYVCFGSDESVCPDDNLYRIIGVFGSQVKLIKWDYANSNLLGIDGNYYSKVYDKNSYETYKGVFVSVNRYTMDPSSYQNSELNLTNLNKNYLDNIGNVWSSKIYKKNWVIPGSDLLNYMNYYNDPIYAIFQNEIINPTETVNYEGKIGLMYISDYGYAASSDFWTTSGSGYDVAVNDNWMYMGLKEWAISYFAGSPRNYQVLANGKIAYSPFNLDDRETIRPTFYLNSDVTVNGSHTGSKTDPIRIN